MSTEDKLTHVLDARFDGVAQELANAQSQREQQLAALEGKLSGTVGQ